MEKGDVIQAEDLNRIEQGITDASIVPTPTTSDNGRLMSVVSGHYVLVKDKYVQHLSDGAATGSLRASTALQESSSYSLGSGAVALGSSQAPGSNSFAANQSNTASGFSSYAIGTSTTASGKTSYAAGHGTIANHAAQYVFGSYNVPDPAKTDASTRGTYIEIVGNGSVGSTSNARTLDWQGNETLKGNLTLGKGTSDEVTISASQLKQLLALLNQ